MPFPNEHAARQSRPTGCIRVRRENDWGGAGVHAVWCVRRVAGEQKAVLQSIRFDKKKFTAVQAKAWLKEHDFKTNVEKARAA